MARPERNEVDYFPFYCKEGRIMFIIEQKYGNDGYATWVKLLRALATTNYHYIDLSNEIDVYYLATKCRVTNEMLLEIIDLLVISGELDKELWEEKRVIWNQKFVDSIEDAYSRRNNDLMNRDTLIHRLGGLCSAITPQNDTVTPQSTLKGNNKPQSKVYNNKVEESIEEKKKFFQSTLAPFVEKYGRDFINDFYLYWAEPTQDNKQLRYELEKTWGLSRRLSTWVKNSKKFGTTLPKEESQKFRAAWQ